MKLANNQILTFWVGPTGDTLLRLFPRTYFEFKITLSLPGPIVNVDMKIPSLLIYFLTIIIELTSDSNVLLLWGTYREPSLPKG